MPSKRRINQLDNTNFEQSDDPACVFFYADVDETPKVATDRDELKRTLQTSSFLVAEIKRPSGIFLKVSLPPPKMLSMAEKLGILVRLRENNGGALHEFQYAMAEAGYYKKCSEDSWLSSGQQLMVIEHTLMADKSQLGADVDIKHKIEEDNTLTDFFYLHYEPTRKILLDTWANAWFSPQPIELVREYFGEKVGLYFLWLGYYTTMLWIPALAGTLLVSTQIYTYIKYDTLDNPWIPLYCIFSALWAMSFMLGWKRLEATKRLQWGTEGCEDEEEDRPAYTEFLALGKYKRRNKKDYSDESYYPSYMRNLWIALTTSIVLVIIGVVLVVVTGIFVLRYFLISILGDTIGSPLGSLLNAATILLFNMLYANVVEQLTELETWRTDTEFEDSLIAKNFCFNFVNSYFALFFVAFIQNNVSIFGYDMSCPDKQCLPVLTMTLGIVFGTQIVIQQAMEFGLPKFKRWWKSRQSASAMKDANLQEEEETVHVLDEQAAMQEDSGVFEDYNEMVVQFGYVTLFAAAFPLAALLALVNNIMEIRVDAIKRLEDTRRPKPRRAEDIGTWMTILEVLTTVAIMTSVALVGWTSHGIHFYYPNISDSQKLWTLLLFEHCLLLAKAVCEAQFSGAPQRFVSEAEAQQYFKKKALRRFVKEQREAALLEDDELSDEDDEDGDRR